MTAASKQRMSPLLAHSDVAAAVQAAPRVLQQVVAVAVPLVLQPVSQRLRHHRVRLSQTRHLRPAA